jgi:hypothetical protein
MKKFTTGIYMKWALAVLLPGMLSFQQPSEADNQPVSFSTGEHLEYRVHYGFLNAAEAIVDVSDKFHRVKGKTCYRVTAVGRTTGAFDLVTRVRDSWQSYIDTQTLMPSEFYMKQQEGRYFKEQRISFDQGGDKVVSATKGKNSPEEYKEFKAPDKLHDVISGYFFLRTIDFGSMKEGQVVTVKAFYDNEFYDLRVKYVGRETIKTKFGKLNTHRIIPQMPKNELFDGKEAIRIWVSDDVNKVPVKVEFDLMVGAVAMDLRSYKNLKEEFHWQ